MEGITCKTSSCYKRDSAWRWRTIENAKVFLSYAKEKFIQKMHAVTGAIQEKPKQNVMTNQVCIH